MSLFEIFALSLGRSFLVAGVGQFLSGHIVDRISSPDPLSVDRSNARRRTRFRIILLLILTFIPLFVPELITGFIWRPVSARFMNLSAELLEAGWSPNTGISVLTFGDLITEAIYSVLLLVRVTAIGCAARLLLPASPVSAASLHSWQLLRQQVGGAKWRWNWLLLSIAGRWRTGIVAWCLMVLIGLQEFETAALMQLDHSPVVWTVTLFDAHAAHQPLTDSLRMIASPLIAQIALLGPMLALLLISGRSREIRSEEQECSRGRSGVFGRWISASWLAIAILIAIVWPVAGQTSALMDAVILMWGNPALLTQSLGQVAVSLGFALAAAIVSLRIAAFLLDATGWVRCFWLVVLPGLTGPLVCSLMVLALFQWPLMRPLYDTWLPLLAGSSLTVLPRAVFVVLLVRRMAPADSVYSAELLGSSPLDIQRASGSRLRVRLYIMSWIAAAAAVSHWCFWDVTTVSILRPVDVEPVITRLYNEMHYGRTEILILMSAISVLTIPVCAAIVLLGVQAVNRMGLFRLWRRSPRGFHQVDNLRSETLN